jgi:hypothetical protein
MGFSWAQIYYHLLHERVRTSKGKEWSMGRILRGYEAELRLQAAERREAVDEAVVPAAGPVEVSDA